MSTAWSFVASSRVECGDERRHVPRIDRVLCAGVSHMGNTTPSGGLFDRDAVPVAETRGVGLQHNKHLVPVLQRNSSVGGRRAEVGCSFAPDSEAVDDWTREARQARTLWTGSDTRSQRSGYQERCGAECGHRQSAQPKGSSQVRKASMRRGHSPLGTRPIDRPTQHRNQTRVISSTQCPIKYVRPGPADDQAGWRSCGLSAGDGASRADL